ncbi:MAG: cadherin domain-containing protein [Desulfamplus sp.]|nr:cadherin domain-containing protein [Desulfamplus sp.]
MQFKKKLSIYSLFTIFLSAILGITSVYSQLCNSDNLSMCVEALDKDNIAIDEASTFQNTKSVNIKFDEITYGKAVIAPLQLHNTGSTDVITISSNSAQSFPWAYLNIKQSDYVNSGSSDYIWSIYSSSGLVIKSGNTKSFDITFAPIPPSDDSSGIEPNKFSGMKSHTFQQWNPFDVRLSSMSFEVSISGQAQGSLGKKFSVDVNELNGSSSVTVTPDITGVSLEDDEYLLVYFEVVQKDGNPYKEIVVLNEDEETVAGLLNKALQSGQVDNSGSTAAYSHRQFSNGNILLRSRDTKNEHKTKYWLLFKSSEAINLKCYKKTITATGSGYNTSGAAEADLKFIYADTNGKRVEEFTAVYATDNTTTPTNLQPNTPSNPNPSDNASVNSGALSLSWSGGDPNGDPVTYRLYFSQNRDYVESNQNSAVAATLNNATYNVGGILAAGKYYWKVVATDGSLTTTGSVWSFTVADDTTPPIEQNPVSFWLGETDISKTGLTLKKGESADITVKIAPAFDLTFDLVSYDTESIELKPNSLMFTSMLSTAAFKVTALDEITDPVTISLNTTNPDYKKDDGSAYTLTLSGSANTSPTITSSGGGETTTISVEENQTAVITVVATDKENDTLIYIITGGDDKDKFNINAASGLLEFKDAPDYENPTDSNTDNSYNIEITVTDSGGLTDSQEIIVTIIDDESDNNPVNLPRVPKEQLFEEIKTVSLTPIVPNFDDPIGQPLAVGDVDKNKQIELSFSYPAYDSKVDIYMMIIYEDSGKNSMLFITKPDNIGIGFTTEVKPLFSDLDTAQSGTLFSIDTEMLKQFGLTGKYTFYSGVFPAGKFDIYDITYFSMNIN